MKKKKKEKEKKSILTCAAVHNRRKTKIYFWALFYLGKGLLGLDKVSCLMFINWCSDLKSIHGKCKHTPVNLIMAIESAIANKCTNERKQH